MKAARISFRDQRSAPPGWKRRIVHVLILAAAVWLAGFLAFAAAIPAQVRDAERPVDAIVVLTGGGVRLAEGFALLDKGIAKKMLISGVADGVELPALLQTMGGDVQPNQNVLDCCVTLGHDARSTEGNARESLRWMTDNGFKSLRLVTANYHINRSLLEFRRVMPGIEIVSNPVFPGEVQNPYWFVHGNTLYLLVNEYHKYLFAAARVEIADLGNTVSGLGTRIASLAGL